jgi:hypothetical protein
VRVEKSGHTCRQFVDIVLGEGVEDGLHLARWANRLELDKTRMRGGREKEGMRRVEAALIRAKGQRKRSAKRERGMLNSRLSFGVSPGRLARRRVMHRF